MRSSRRCLIEVYKDRLSGPTGASSHLDFTSTPNIQSPLPLADRIPSGCASSSRLFNMSAKLGHDLGSLELSYPDSGLQLRLSSTAQFASSGEDDIDQLSELTISNTTWSLPWVSRTRSTRLLLELAGAAFANAIQDEEFHALLLAQVQDWQVSILNVGCRDVPDARYNVGLEAFASNSLICGTARAQQHTRPSPSSTAML